MGNSAALVPGQLGATYFLPTLVVPLLMVTHVIAFRILLQRSKEAATWDGRDQPQTSTL